MAAGRAFDEAREMIMRNMIARETAPALPRAETMAALPACLAAWLRQMLTGLLAVLLLSGNVRAEEVLFASGHPAWPPFSWQQGEQIVGIGPELVEILFNDLGIKVASNAIGNWKRVQLEAEAGRVDLIVSLYQTEERKKYVVYPLTPYFEDVNVLWVKKGKAFTFNKWDDLIGKNGTALLGESYGQQFDQFIKDKLTMERVNKPFQNLQKLEMGRSDYYPFSLYGGEIQVRQLGFDGKIEHLPEVISKENVYFGISKKSHFIKYLPQLEAAIEKRRADGTVERLVRKYIALAAAMPAH